MKKVLVAILCLALLLTAAISPAMAKTSLSGTFTAESQGYSLDDTIKVTVTLKNGRIADIKATGRGETPDIGGVALPILIQRAVRANSAEIDIVTGATWTSEGFIVALQEALNKAGFVASATQATPAPTKASGNREGIYAGEAEGFGGPVEVVVTVKNGKITDIEASGAQESRGYDTAAFPDLIQRAKQANSADIDVVAGATWTSKGFIAALEQALTEAGLTKDETTNSAPSGMASGTYLGQAEGFSTQVPIQLSVTVKNGVITKIDVTKHEENVYYAETAFDALMNQAIESNSADLDVITGATWTSKGFIDALKAALAKAGMESAAATAKPSSTPAPTQQARQFEYDFKTFNWGDSKEKVMAAEGRPALSERMRDGTGEYLAYNTTAVEQKVILVYYFTNDNRLHSVVYLSDEQHEDTELFIQDYAAFKSAMSKKYGSPALDKENWQNSSRKNAYENRKGSALDLGYLTLQTRYETDTTLILMDLSMVDGLPRLTVTYNSLTVSPVEKDYSDEI